MQDSIAESYLTCISIRGAIL